MLTLLLKLGLPLALVGFFPFQLSSALLLELCGFFGVLTRFSKIIQNSLGVAEAVAVLERSYSQLFGCGDVPRLVIILEECQCAVGTGLSGGIALPDGFLRSHPHSLTRLPEMKSSIVAPHFQIVHVKSLKDLSLGNVQIRQIGSDQDSLVYVGKCGLIFAGGSANMRSHIKEGKIVLVRIWQGALKRGFCHVVFPAG